MLWSRGSIIVLCCSLAACAVDPDEPQGSQLATARAEIALQWSTLDLGGGSHPSLALDGAGNPALSFHRGIDNPVQISGDITPAFASNSGTWRDGTGWTTTNIAAVPGNVDGFANTLGFASTPQIAFNSRVRLDLGSGYTLKLGRQTSSGWQVSTIESTPWVYQVVQRVTGTTPYLAYTSTAQTGVVFARPGSGSGWSKVTVSDLSHDLLFSLDAAVVPGTTTVGLATTTLFPTTSPVGPRGVHFTASSDGGATWRSAVHVDSSAAAVAPQLVYSGTKPMIAYTHTASSRIRLATSSNGGTTWSLQTVATFGTPPSAGLAVDGNGAPLLAIVASNPDAGVDELWLARRAARGGWSLELVDSIDTSQGTHLAANPRIAVTSDRRVVIAYEYGTYLAGHVKLAWSSAL